MKVDLHQCELSEAIVDLLTAVQECKATHDPTLEIVHGFKHGQILRDYVRSPKFIQMIAKEGIIVKKIAGSNPGSTLFQIL